MDLFSNFSPRQHINSWVHNCHHILINVDNLILELLSKSRSTNSDQIKWYSIQNVVSRIQLLWLIFFYEKPSFRWETRYYEYDTKEKLNVILIQKTYKYIHIYIWISMSVQVNLHTPQLFSQDNYLTLLYLVAKKTSRILKSK